MTVAGHRTEGSQQQCAKPVTLVGVHHLEGQLGGVGLVGEPDVAAHGDPRSALVQGEPGEVVDEVDVCEVVDDLFGRLTPEKNRRRRDSSDRPRMARASSLRSVGNSGRREIGG